MDALFDLWLPILLSAVFVFLASSIIHMLLPIHKGDYKPLPGEADVMAAMRGQQLQPGDYMFPHCGSMKELGTLLALPCPATPWLALVPVQPQGLVEEDQLAETRRSPARG